MVETAVARGGSEVAPPRSLAAGAPAGRATLLAAPLRSLPHPSRLRRSLSVLRGVGPKLSQAAERVGLATLADMIEHVPHSHRERGGAVPVAELRLAEEATIEVEVRSVRLRPTRRRNLSILEATVADESGPTRASWFNQAWLAERLKPGTRVLLNGRLDRTGFRVANYEILGAAGDAEGDGPGRDPLRAGPDGPPRGLHTTGLVPVHPAGEGLRPQKLREWAFAALAGATDVIEPLPGSLRAARGMPAAADARIAAHFPADERELAAARRRLAYEELFLHQAALLARRRDREDLRAGIPLEASGELIGRWIASLPFELTADQRCAIELLEANLRDERPMQRLLMGEVGSGKTVVALYAMLRALESGGQAALMAPTETLAEQHFATLERLLAGNPLPAALLTGSTPAARRRETLGRLASGELGLVVGTHALIEPVVGFARLSVVVVDEQHRFGVRQRRELDAKGPGERAPHVLHMTATPIPRTLSLTAYGDLDVTMLRELPAGRKPIKTWVVGEERRPGAYAFIRERLREGRQAYIVCPLVSESESGQAKAATEEAARLAAGELADHSIEVLHGQMPSARKAEAMARFASGEAEVLVATSVIEVGIDVPNATVMLIEGADRYGLSQLHQLRGRIGRGEHESHCILFADPESERARARLEAIERSGDGFELAEVDLTLRGEGEVLGTRQHGLPRFRVACLPDDADLLARARGDLIALIDEHGALDAVGLGPLIDAVRARFGDERAEPIAA